MRLPASERARWALVVAVGALLLAALNLWWVLTYRQDFPLNVDEAGYTAIGVADYLGLRADGLQGWWSAVQSQTPNAPLLPTVSSLAMVFKPGVMVGFAVLIGFLVVLIFATYGIGERLAGPRLGALAALVVGTSQGAFLFTREYVFALPTAAMLSAAVYALLRSERMRSWPWAVAFGAAIGLMLLARTMAIAFVPGLGLAALVLMLAADRAELRRRFLNLGIAALSGVVVAATWYYHNLVPVWDYLTNYGYGDRSAYYGAEQSVLSWGRLRSVTDRMVADDLLVPLAVLVVAGLIVLAAVAVRRVVDSEDRRHALLRLAGSGAMAVAIVIAAGVAALMTSRNGGNGFTLPLSMLLPPLAVAALRHVRLAIATAVAVLAAVAVLNVAATSSLWAGLAKPRLVDVPGFGMFPWINGTPHTLGAIRYQIPGPPTRFVDRDRGWTEADQALAAMLLKRIEVGVESPVVAFASRNRAISSNSVQLAALLDHRQPIPFTQLESEPGGDTVANYRRQLNSPELGEPGMLLTMDRNTDDFPPLITQSKAEAAARPLGFQRVATIALPDGRRLRIWEKRSPPANAAPARSSGGAASAPRSRRG